MLAIIVDILETGNSVLITGLPSHFRGSFLSEAVFISESLYVSLSSAQLCSTSLLCFTAEDNNLPHRFPSRQIHMMHHNNVTLLLYYDTCCSSYVFPIDACKTFPYFPSVAICKYPLRIPSSDDLSYCPTCSPKCFTLSPVVIKIILCIRHSYTTR